LKIPFYKYQGTGNDFILIDNRAEHVNNLSKKQVETWCNRRFGIGADGLILLEKAAGFDFRMVYYNSDGRESSMCGNGGRCIVRFACDLDIISKEALFIAADGPHKALAERGTISLQMKDVSGIEKISGDFYLNTGSPHYVRYVEPMPESWNMPEEAKSIRYSERFREEGTNVNFITEKGDILEVRTYERGVEDETYSCGTGVTAAALVHAEKQEEGKNYTQKICTPGGNLEVSFDKAAAGQYVNIWLHGPATFVFSGEITG
jgi:diaminopimelate epimerase